MRKSGSQGALIGYISVMKNINSIIGERIDNIRKLANMTAREMLNDFRNVQQSATKLDTPTKGQKEKEANANVAKAINFAKAHANGAPHSTRGMTWFNRSMRAVRGVNAMVIADSETIAIQLSHGIYYGAYLEYGHNRRYAILEPLIRQYGPKFFEDARRVIGGAVQ
jgi:hypothetical protein